MMLLIVILVIWACRLTGNATELKIQCLWIRIPPRLFFRDVAQFGRAGGLETAIFILKEK